MNFNHNLDIECYKTAGSIWPGIIRFVNEKKTIWPNSSETSLTEKEVSKLINKEAQNILAVIEEDGQANMKDFDTFRKAMSNLKNGKTLSIKKDNLFRLLFVLHISSDLEAQHFLVDYLHMNELSARVLEEFIVLSALKLQLSWSQTKELLYDRHAELIADQENSPDNTVEGYTAEVYSSVIDNLNSIEDLNDYLEEPSGRASFAKSSNTRYLALFFDVIPEAATDNDSGKTYFKILDSEGNNIPVSEYRREFFSLCGNSSDDALTLTEIDELSQVFDDIFLDGAEFDALVHRHRITDISSGIFILSYLNRLDPDDEDFEFYIDFLDPDDFKDALDEWLLYYGFPLMNPDCSSFDKLLLDIHKDMLDQIDSADSGAFEDITNADFYDEYLTSLRYYLRKIIE